MSTFFQILTGLTAGALLGYFFFYGLWWSLQRTTGHDHPFRVMLVSFAVRSVVVTAGFYGLLLLGWQVLATAVPGFVIMRMVLVSRWGTGNLEPETGGGRRDGI
ncbi:MAG: ATP synthase subunit I [Balneolaceae bacterium]|nr:ATP synthase subunit I [Balneolaceae bacterium]